MKRDISVFNWANIGKSLLDKETIAEYKLPENMGWILPQALALVGTLPLARVNDKYSFTESIRRISSSIDTLSYGTGKPITLEELTGILKLLKYSPRGSILPKVAKQISSEWSRYSTAVPLILSAFLEYRGIKYSQWDWSDENKRFFVEANIVDVSDYFGHTLPWTKEELLVFRDVARRVKSGINKDSLKSIQATTSITGVEDIDFKSYPALMKTMLCQTWVYHPSMRHKYAITNTQNIDEPAEELVATDVLITTTKTENMWAV